MTRRAGPFVVLIGLLAFVSGLPAGRLTSFSPLHQVLIITHAVLGLGFVGLFLLFIGRHVRETTEQRRTGLWIFAIFIYGGVREVFLREFAFIYPVLYLGPILLAWWVVDRQLRRAVVTLAVAVPVLGVALALALGSDPVLSIFTLPYYAEILCIVALVMGRPGVQASSPGPNASARRNGFYYTFAALSAGISGVFLAVGTGQMQVGQGFRDAHTATSLLLVLAGLYHARSGIGARRALGLDMTLKTRLTRWAMVTAVGGGVTVGGFAYMLHLIAVHDPPPQRAAFVPAAMALPSNWRPAGNRVLDALDFRDPEACKSCHPSQTEQWNASAHRFSASPALRLLVKEARKLRGIQGERYCLGCHAPRAILTGELQGDGQASAESLDAGVGCLACHEAEAAHGSIGNASHVIVTDPPILFERSADYDGFFTPALLRLTPLLHIRRYSKPYLRDPHLCGGCHLERQSEMLGPHTGILQDTFTSWSKSDYAKPRADGRPAATCEDCHMPRLWLSKKQEGVHDHRMFGGPETFERDGVDATTKRVAAAWLQGDRGPLLAEAREAFRRRYAPGQPEGSEFDASTATLWEEKLAGREFPPADIWPAGPLIGMELRLVDTQAAETDGRLVVSLTNRAIGHDFPAGPRDVVEAWLRVEVRDASGRIVLASGTEAGSAAPGIDARRLGGEPVDASGKHVERHHVWEIAEIRNDRVIPPKATVEESFSLPSLSSFRRPLAVDAALLYRFPGARIVRELLGDGVAAPPPVTLVHAQASFP